jgi:hypothetical protein
VTGTARDAARVPTSAVQRAAHPVSAAVQHMSVDLSRLHILVPEQFLHRADVVAVFQQVGRETVAQRMCTDRIVEVGRTRCLLERTVQVRVIPVMSSNHAAVGIH